MSKTKVACFNAVFNRVNGFQVDKIHYHPGAICKNTAV